MEIIDLRTVFLNFLLTDFISLVFLTVLWYQNRKRYDGLHLIAIDFLFHFISISLIFLRGYIPDFISIIVANGFGISSGFIGFIGFAKFIGYKPKMRFNFFIVVFFIATHTYFTYVSPDLVTRNLNLAIAYFVFCAQTAWILLYKAPVHLRKLCRSTGVIFVIFCVINLIRIIGYFILNHDNTQNYFQSGLFEIIIPLLYQIVLLTMSFFIVLMVNKRLILDISTEENKLSVIYQSVPYAILITEKLSGNVLDVNIGFEQISGYARNEVIGKSTFELNLWNNPTERDIIINKLKNNKRVENMEFQFRKISGEIIIGLISSQQIMVQNKECILSVINDITEKKNSEIELKNSREILKKLVLVLQTEHEQEKFSLASQLDNNLNQSLASLRINIGILKKKLVSNGNPISDEIIQIVDNTYQQTGVTIERSLTLMNKMRNEVLYLLGFDEAISYTLEEIEKKYKVSCVLESDIKNIKLEQHKSSNLFLIVQELLNQILIHNKATAIHVKLTQIGDNLILTIVENGKSFTNSDDLKSNEMIGIINEKLGLFNGHILITPNSKNTTEIVIEMPL